MSNMEKTSSETIKSMGRGFNTLDGVSSPRKSKKIERICKKCGKVFYVFPHKIKDKRGTFCSVKCVDLSRKKRIIRKCLICKKIFDKTPATIKRGEGKFCSRECYGEWRSKNKKGENSPYWKKRKIRKCFMCNKFFSIIPSEIKRGSGKFCSHSCRAIWMLVNKKIKETDIEKMIEKELKKRKIQYKKQYPIHQARTVVDFLLNDKIIIYCDGDFWHYSKWAKKKGVPNKDENQNTLLSLNGYKVFRFSGTEIKKSVGICIDRILIKGG